MKEKALLMIKEKYEDVYKEEQTSFMAQSAVAIIQSLFKTTRPGFSDDNIYFRIRKLALEFVIRFVPLDAYKAHTSDFEDQLCNAVYEENEAMALMILKYFIDYLKAQILY
uniref:Uncharacterized protein n=1 Tax=Panagrolaimus sp. JU765 TaxID=591449 RepID=A0AC34RSU4_9BILA